MSDEERLARRRASSSDDRPETAKDEQKWSSLRLALERTGVAREQVDHELVRAAMGPAQHDAMAAALRAVQEGAVVALLSLEDVEALVADVLAGDATGVQYVVATDGEPQRAQLWVVAQSLWATRASHADVRRVDGTLELGIHRARVTGQRWHERFRTRTLRLRIGS